MVSPGPGRACTSTYVRSAAGPVSHCSALARRPGNYARYSTDGICYTHVGGSVLCGQSRTGGAGPRGQWGGMHRGGSVFWFSPLAVSWCVLVARRLQPPLFFSALCFLPLI